MNLIDHFLNIKLNMFVYSLDVTKSCDCVLWAGDMNFRIAMSHEQVLAHCKESKYSELLLRDELRTGQMKTGKENL